MTVINNLRDLAEHLWIDLGPLQDEEAVATRISSKFGKYNDLWLGVLTGPYQPVNKITIEVRCISHLTEGHMIMGVRKGTEGRFATINNCSDDLLDFLGIKRHPYLTNYGKAVGMPDASIKDLTAESPELWRSVGPFWIFSNTYPVTALPPVEQPPLVTPEHARGIEIGGYSVETDATIPVHTLLFPFTTNELARALTVAQADYDAMLAEEEAESEQ